MQSFAATQLDQHAYLDTWAHRLDSRAKIATTLVFAATVVSFPKYAVGPLAAFALYPLALGILGRVPARLILARLLWVSPFVLLVGAFNPVFDRREVARIGAVSIAGGWISFASIAVRFFLTVGAALLLVATTPFPLLCQGLARLRVPRALVVQLLFLYRYLFVLVDEGARLMRARELRAGLRARRARSMRVAASMLGVLFTRALERAERIHRAMVARGFDGEIPTLNRLRWRLEDTIFLCLVVALCVALRVFPLNVLLVKWLMP